MNVFKTAALSIALSVAVSAFAGDHSDNLIFTTIGLEDGLSQLSVIKICQDAKGYMWFGTRNGLNRYDGSHMKVYKNEKGDASSLVDNYITALTLQGDSLLWIGTMHGLNRMDLRFERMERPAYSDLDLPIRAICFDSNGRFWLGTPQGVFLYSGQEDKFLLFEDSGLTSRTYIIDIQELSDGRIAFCSERDGVYVFDAELKDCEHLCEDNLLPANGVNNIFEDSRGKLWISTHTGGLVCLDGSRTSYFNSGNSVLTTDDVRCCMEMDGTVFVGTANGMFLIEEGILSSTHTSRRTGNLSHYSIYSMCKDSSGGLWIGTYAGGVNYCNPLMNRFRFVNLASAADGITGPVVSSDTPGELFIATEGGGLLLFDTNTEKISSFLYDASNVHGRNILKSLMREGDIIWCGTRQGSVYQFDIRRKSFVRTYDIAPNVPVYAIKRDRRGNLFLATSRPGMGLVRITPEGVIQTRFKINGEEREFESMRCLEILDDGRLLLGSGNNGLYIMDMETGQTIHYGTDETGSYYLPSDSISSISMDAKGYLWIGLNGGGMALLGKDAAIERLYGIQEGLANEEVSILVADKQDNVWIASNGYISKYDPTLNRFLHYKISAAEEFTPNCGALLSNGDISLSTSNGLISFNPEELKTNSLPPAIVFTDLFIHNERVVASEGSPLKQSLDNTPVLRLKYNQNDIIVSYCALNYLYPEQNLYAYRLSGYEKQWNYVGNRQEAYYTRLRPGKYTFEVKASNNDGLWNEQGRSLQIVIRPPIWATWYAFLLYAIILAALLGQIIYSQSSKKLLEQELQFKQKEQVQQEEFHKQKMRMYTNFSHELRTPLMLILSPLEELISTKVFDPDVKGKLDLVYNNSQRLSALVDQLLDLSKSLSGKMKLKVREGDLCLFLNEICSAFNHLAFSKGIHLKYSIGEGHKNAWYDPSLFEKVVFNLLSNAIKYTVEGGMVELSLKDADLSSLPLEQKSELMQLPEGTPLLELLVRDTGSGIPEEEILHIFEPFYQAGEHSLPGTGIGLSLTHSIVKLHHGTVWAENNPDGGACFHVVFPSLKSLYASEELEADRGDAMLKEVVTTKALPRGFSMDKRYTLLLVEDNPSVRAYLKDCLKEYFDVIDTDNGDTAWKLVCDKYPNIVVSDIMMRGKDGLELCRQIKEDIMTGHIPVILMTAKAMTTQVIEGLDTGADDYIIKPFNIDVLLYRIRNILLTREKLKQLYGKRQTEEEPQTSLLSFEDRFTKKFYGIIEHNISNPDLSIDLICHEIGVSRTNLYRKLKAITELSPVELIRSRRLEVAARLLATTTNSILDIATYTGFNSLAYFSSCFKAYFGCTPTEYRESHRN